MIVICLWRLPRLTPLIAQTGVIRLSYSSAIETVRGSGGAGCGRSVAPPRGRKRERVTAGVGNALLLVVQDLPVRYIKTLWVVLALRRK